MAKSKKEVKQAVPNVKAMHVLTPSATTFGVAIELDDDTVKEVTLPKEIYQEFAECFNAEDWQKQANEFYYSNIAENA